MTVGIITHKNCLLHDVGDFHPESPARLASILEHIKRFEYQAELEYFQAEPIDPTLLSLVHQQDYLEQIFTNAPKQNTNQRFKLDEDTEMMSSTLPAALLAAGAATQAVDKVIDEEIKRAFCATRPPGHHAEPDRAMGFCLFNNIALAAAYALKQKGLSKVAILDFDVHHGNGTEAIFADNSQVLFCSTFQSPFYPFSGTNSVSNNIINTPLSANCDGIPFRGIVSDQWLPALEDFSPQMLFISAGFDAHRDDTMSQLNFVEADYHWVTQQLRIFADQQCEGKIVSTLEGGYDLDSLGRSVVAHLKGLI